MKVLITGGLGHIGSYFLNRAIEFNNIDTKVVAMTILTSLQGINWFCLYEDSQVSAEEYLKTSMSLLIKSLKKGS